MDVKRQTVDFLLNTFVVYAQELRIRFVFIGLIFVGKLIYNS